MKVRENTSILKGKPIVFLKEKKVVRQLCYENLPNCSKADGALASALEQMQISTIGSEPMDLHP